MNKIKLISILSFLSAGSIYSQNVGIGTLSPLSKLHIKGSANVPQLIIDANSTQGNFFPLMKLRNSLGKDLMWMHTDDSSNVFIGLRAGRFNNPGAMGLNNTFIGSDAGNSNTTGAFNTANGNHALYSNTTGAYNTATGSGALFSNTIGASNTSTGSYNLINNTTGSNNSSSGYGSLFSNTTGSNNTASGYEALISNTTGFSNVAVGTRTLFTNTIKNNLVAIGDSALYTNGLGASMIVHATNNTGVGSKSLLANTIGFSNTAIGYQSLKSNTSGPNNTAIGSSSMLTNTTGSNNTAIGTSSMLFNTTGHANVAIGSSALRSNTLGSFNSALGFNALNLNTTGTSNIAIGYETLKNNLAGKNNTAMGYRSLHNNTSGIYNTAIGDSALITTITGNKNTVVGHKANVSLVDISNSTAIGANAYAGASNSVVIGSINGVNGATSSTNVGIGTTTPNPSSVLDLSSTTKGFLPPRMSESERSSIASPAEGLVIWCTNCGVYGQLQVHNGIVWTNMLGGAPASMLVIGDSDGGGIVAYLLQPGDPGYVPGENHGLIAAPFDLGDLAWGCPSFEISGADGTALGTGNQNTIDIVNGCATPGIAARICNDLVLEGYNDWYLPSKDELNKIYLNRAAIGGFASQDYYWSSSEFNITYAWSQYFGSGDQFYNLFGKDFTCFVRAVRAF